MKLNEIMTREVEVVQPDDTLQVAAQKMRQWNIGFLLVFQGDQVLGVLTDRDIIMRAIADGANPRNARVRDYMTTPVVHCFEDENIDDVAGLMQDHQIRRVVVLKSWAGAIGWGRFIRRSRQKRRSPAFKPGSGERFGPD